MPSYKELTMEEAEPFRMLELLSNGVAGVGSDTSLEVGFTVEVADRLPPGAATFRSHRRSSEVRPLCWRASAGRFEALHKGPFVTQPGTWTAQVPSNETPGKKLRKLNSGEPNPAYPEQKGATSRAKKTSPPPRFPPWANLRSQIPQINRPFPFNTIPTFRPCSRKTPC
jgi:hypothetical protein